MHANLLGQEGKRNWAISPSCCLPRRKEERRLGAVFLHQRHHGAVTREFWLPAPGLAGGNPKKIRGTAKVPSEKKSGLPHHSRRRTSTRSPLPCIPVLLHSVPGPMQEHNDGSVHPKSKQIGRIYFPVQKNWREKCVYKEDKSLKILYII